MNWELALNIPTGEALTHSRRGFDSPGPWESVKSYLVIVDDNFTVGSRWANPVHCWGLVTLGISAPLACLPRAAYHTQLAVKPSSISQYCIIHAEAGEGRPARSSFQAPGFQQTWNCSYAQMIKELITICCQDSYSSKTVKQRNYSDSQQWCNFEPRGHLAPSQEVQPKARTHFLLCLQFS